MRTPHLDVQSWNVHIPLVDYNKLSDMQLVGDHALTRIRIKDPYIPVLMSSNKQRQSRVAN